MIVSKGKREMNMLKTSHAKRLAKKQLRKENNKELTYAKI